MPKFFDILRNLLPTGRAWRTVTEKQLRQLVDGVATSRDTAKDFATDIYFDLFPEDTRELEEWEYQFALDPTGTETDRRNALAATWKIQGGQDVDYIQSVLRNADFDVTIHEWWSSGPPYVARDPRNYTKNPLIGTEQCSSLSTQPACSALASQPQCNRFLANDPGYFDNLDLTQNAPPAIPSDATKWPYFLYIGGATIDDVLSVEAGSKPLFQKLIQRIKPAQQWIVTRVEYVTPKPSTIFLGINYEIRVDSDGKVYVWEDALPSFIRDNLIAFDASVGTTVDGFNKCAKWENQGRGGSTYDLTQATSSKQPVLQDSFSKSSGRKAIRFFSSLNQSLSNSGIGTELQFLHDGSPASWYLVYRLKAAASKRTLFATRSSVANSVGLQVYQDASDVPTALIGNGSAEAALAGDALADEDNKILSSVQEDGASTELKLWQALTATATATYLASPSSADAAGLYVGTAANEAEFWDAEIMALIIDDNAHTPTIRKEIEDWLVERFATAGYEHVNDSLVVWDATEGVETDLNGEVTRWRNLGSGGSTYDATPPTVAARPGRDINDPELNQYPVLTFDGTQCLTSGTISDYEFLHDGTGCTVYVVVRPDSLTDAFLVSTRTSTGAGFNAFLTSSSSTLQANATVHNASAEILSATGGGLAESEPVVYVFRFQDGIGTPESNLYLNTDSPVASEDTTGTPKAGTHDLALMIGATASGTSLLTGAIAYIAIDNSRHSDATISKNIDWLTRRFGIA